MPTTLCRCASVALVAVLALAGAGGVVPASAQDRVVAAAASPEAVVKALHDGLLAMAMDHGDAGIDARRAALRPVVAATHDLPYIAELAIRRQWPELSAEERQRYLDAFERLSVTTYASRFRALEPGRFTIEGSGLAAGGRAEVTASLQRADGPPIPFQYVLHETADGWKIVNILADNVSDLALKRAEYRRLLEGGSIDTLVAELDAQSAKLAAAE